MSVHSIASFSNHLATRIPSRPRVAGRHSVPRLFAPKTETPKPQTGRRPISPERQREIDDMLERGRKNPPPAPDKTPEPDNYPQ